MIADKLLERDEIIEKLSSAYPKSEFQKDKNILHLDLTDPKYKLSDLEELEKDHEYIQYFLHLNTIDLFNNRLSILKLKGFNFLEKIVCVNNMISKVELMLPKLKKLDLSSNMLDKIPELANLPNLEELRLNKNSITKITYEEFKFVKATLNTLEISYNKIQFLKVKEFFDFAETFGRNMRKLRGINVQKNPFSLSKVYGKEYPSAFIYYCESLNAIDGKTIEESEKEQSRQINSIKSKILENEKEFGHLLNQEIQRQKDFGINSRDEITLANITRGMERYQTVSRMGQNSFRELKDIIEEYLNITRSLIDPSEEELLLEEENEELEEYEKFLEACNVIIENSSSLEKPLFDIVANFTVIKSGKFSDLSLTFFKHHLSSPEKAKDIEEVIQKTIISYINNQKVEEIPASIISGLQAFAQEAKFKKMILELTTKLIGIVETFKDVRVIGIKTGQIEENKRRNILSASLSFLSVKSEDSDVLNKMMESFGFLEAISTQIKNLLTQGEEIIIGDERGIEININLLNIIRCICIFDPEVDSSKANDVTNKTKLESNEKNVKTILAIGLKDKVEQVLTKKIDSYTKNLNDNSNNNSRKMDAKSKEQRLKARELLGNFIRCYGALNRRIDDKSKLNFSNTSVTMIMLNILPLPNFHDPIVISAICDFVFYVFDNPHVRTNTDELFTTIVSKLYSLKYVLNFLFPGPKYNLACHVADSLGQNTVSNGQAVDFENQTSHVMNQMVISIINLITFFGRNSQTGNFNIQQTCVNVCSDLNDMERDDALTGCLVIPSDEVKKAVVKCLFFVDCNEFEKEEIREIYIQISNVNLMAGDIEEVISTIYIILAKAFRNFMLDTSQNNSKEKVEFNKEAFIIAYDILMKNSERVTTDEGESEQKLMLSIALNVFLVNCSCFENIKRFYSERKIATKVFRILNSEETKINEKLSIPIEVEKTRAGWSMINLHECYKNEYPLYPYSLVSLRNMIHVADMMMNVPYKAFDIPENMEFNEIITHLTNEIMDREYNRIQREMKSFKDFIIENKRNKRVNNSIDYMSLNPNEVKEEQYKFINLFPTLLHYLLGKTNQSRVAEFEKIWEDKFDPKFFRLSYSLNEQRNYELNSNIKIKVDEKYLETEDVMTRVKRIMKEESIMKKNENVEITSEYEHIRHDLSKSYLYGSDKDKMRRIPQEETAHNPYLRGLVIASFLRAIWTILEFPQEKAIKDQMIEMLKKGNNIKDISMLVDSTKLTEFNISSKYLIIMRYVLFNSKSNNSIKFNSIEETEYLNQIGVISFMIKKMINVNRNNIKIENEDSKIFLSDLSKCSAVIINEVFNLHYQSDLIREKTMSDMVSYDIIKVFIKTVKEYMNKESETLRKDMINNKSSIRKEDTMNEMISTIVSIIGEYMSKCKEYSYRILESFTKSYIFDKVKMRKTYLREVIETCKMSDLKTRLESEFKNVRIYFLCRCLINDFSNKKEMIVYLMMTENGLNFLEVKSDFSNQEWDLKDYKINEKLRVKFEDILEIFELELTNRIIIKTKKYIYGYCFLKSHYSNELIELLHFHNSNINILRHVKVFSKSEELENNENILNENEDSLIAFLCVINESQRFFNIFQNFMKERELITNSRILVIQGKKLSVYSESLDKWNSCDPQDYIKVEYGNTKLVNLGIFYKFLNEFDLNEMKGVTFLKTDLIVIHFDKMQLEIQLLDDLSYTNLKKAISVVAIEKKFNIMADDIYGNIR